MAPQGKTVILNNGSSMPIIGLGTWQAPKGEVGAAVRTAIENGYRHIDCAACYGNEAEIGEVLADLFAKGVVSREELFVTSKLWNSEHQPKDVKPACEKTLADLKLGYLDMYLIHWPQAFAKEAPGNCSFPKNADGSVRYDTETTTEQTWQALEALVDAGLCKAIGLSNFNSAQITQLMQTCRIPPANLQVEVHPYFSQDPLVDFCRKRDIAVTAYSPLGTGAVIDGATVAGNPTLAAVGEAYGKSAAQVAIAWLAQRGIIVIPKSVTAARIVANRDVDFNLSYEDMAKVDALNKNLRNGWAGPLVERNGKKEPRDHAHPLYPFGKGVDF